MTPTHMTTGPRLPFLSRPGGPWVKKRAGSTHDQLTFRSLIRSRISGPTVSQTPLDRLDRDMGVSADGLGEGSSEEI